MVWRGTPFVNHCIPYCCVVTPSCIVLPFCRNHFIDVYCHMVIAALEFMLRRLREIALRTLRTRQPRNRSGQWYMVKGAFTRVPQVDQRGWINQSEPCKHVPFNGSDQRGWRVNKLAMANFRSTSLIRFGWLTTDYPFVSCFSMYGFNFDNNSKNCSRDILKRFLYISRSSLVHSTNNVFDAPNVLRLIIHG